MESKQTIYVVIALLFVAVLAYWFFQYQGVNAPTTENNTASSTQGSAENTQVSGGPTAVLSVQTDKAVYSVGDQVELTFYADTQVSVSGTDVIFSFDGASLEIVKGLTKVDFTKQISQIAAVNQAERVIGVPSIPYAKSTKVGNQINYTFSAITLPGEGMIGKTKLGTIILKAKKAGDTPIVISFEKEGISTDSNIAYQGRDILKNVEGVIVHVQNVAQ